MKLRLLSLLAVLLFVAGVLLQLLVSGGVVWAEMEASLYGTQATEGGLSLNCPLMLSALESSKVTTAIANSLDQSVSPMITTEISAAGGMKSQSQTLKLAPHETRFLQWPVGVSNIIFGRLILVNVIQGRYGDLASRSGYCGILVLNLFKLKGNQSLILAFIGSLFLIIAGGILWRRFHDPRDASTEQTLKAGGGLAGVSTLALLTALPRWWGLTLFLDAFALIMLSVIFTELLLFPKYDKS
jgi:hypothetical protein